MSETGEAVTSTEAVERHGTIFESDGAGSNPDAPDSDELDSWLQTHWFAPDC